MLPIAVDTDSRTTDIAVESIYVVLTPYPIFCLVASKLAEYHVPRYTENKIT